MLSGMTIVFIALVVLIALVALMGKVFGVAKKQPAAVPASAGPSAPAAAPAPAVRPATPVMAVQSGVGEEAVAAISAAVAVVMGESGAPGGDYAITSIRRSKDLRPVWGFAGMQQNTRPF